MIVYRVERPNHNGPFVGQGGMSREQSNAFYDALPTAAPWLKVEVLEPDEFMQMMGETETARRSWPDATHPHHMMDIGWRELDRLEELSYRFLDPHVRTGVQTLELLHHWFQPTQAAKDFFAKYDYQLSVYDCPDEFVALGKYQLVFICEAARLVERKPFE